MSAPLSDVALLFALPCERDAFDRRLGTSDYLKRFSLDSAGSWTNTYQPQIARPIRDLVDHARALGADVRLEATSDALLAATCVREVVILCAHWKGSEPAQDDFLSQDPSAFLERLDGRDGAWVQWLAERLRSGRVSTALNSFINEESAELEDGHELGFKVMAEPITIRTERRDKVDALFAGLLAPGNLLELADGMCSRAAMNDLIAPTFRGTLDIAACNSSILADYLDRTRRSLFRIVQFPEVLDPELSCLALRLTFDLMIERRSPYISARMEALDFIRTQLRSLVGPRESLWQCLRRFLWKD